MKNFVFTLMISGVLLGLLCSCAPQIESGSPEEAVGMSDPDTMEEIAGDLPQPEPVSTFDPDNPDWQLRYEELYRQHFGEFEEPLPGQELRLTLSTGREVRGILNEITDTEVVMDVEKSGLVSYPLDSLSDESQQQVSASAYALDRAKAQGRLEVQRWQQRQAPRATPVPGTGNVAARPGENGVDGVDFSTAAASVPKNEGPDGRVWQVEQYIRKNSALPHSLRIKAWGRVQPHETGYKVRVQYSRESAGGLGISNEDMMFFMNRNGRVYRQAAVK